MPAKPILPIRPAPDPARQGPTVHEAGEVDSACVVQEILSGEGLSLAEAARLLPHGRRDAPTSPSCLWRWARRGVAGPAGIRIFLETARLGCRTFTSKAALGRFLTALNPPPAPPSPEIQPPEQATRARRQPRSQDRVEAAQEELARLGL
jgi:hypothetical protein